MRIACGNRADYAAPKLGRQFPDAASVHRYLPEMSYAYAVEITAVSAPERTLLYNFDIYYPLMPF